MITPVRWMRTAEFLTRCWLESHRHGPKLRAIERVVAENEPQPQVGDRPVLIFNASTRTWGLSQNAAYSLLLSWGLRLAGVPVRHFVCMAGMEQCTLGTKRTRLKAPPPCGWCTRLSRQLYPEGIRWELETPKDGWQSFPTLNEHQSFESLRQVEVDGLKLGELCFPSLSWALRRINIPDTQEVRSLYKKYLRAAMHIARAFESLLERSPPQAVVVFNGVTFPEAVARQVVLRRGIPVITHEVGVQPFSAFFTHGEATAYPIDIAEEFSLASGEEVLLDEYLSQRFQGDFSMAGVRFWPEMHGLDGATLAKMARFEQTIAVFTNVIFDTSQVHSNEVFPDMFDWLGRVVDYASRHPETLFVIRAHPDELRPGKEAQETVENFLREDGALERANINFVPSRKFISSYDLIRRSKLVFVYNSSIGLEGTLLNRVVLCGGASRYSRYPTVYFPQEVEEYFRLADSFLTQDDPRPPQAFIAEARKFSYIQHFMSSLDFSPFLRAHPKFPGYVELADFNPLDLHPDRCLEIKIVRDGILGNKEMFYDRNDVSKRHRAGSEESISS
ncbi:MAG: hypothetical protein GTO14_24635 [Anaerolineales bacterium]|nr:hypothetical protein [Anaerolineales bacterium]